MTIQGAHGALIALLLIPASLAGYTLRNVPAVWIAANLVALVASYFLARTIHRDQFRRWRRHMDGMTLFDMLRFRHIPYLR
jgi:multisubunit Na+/H+ antiporter MnhG subunit